MNAFISKRVLNLQNDLSARNVESPADLCRHHAPELTKRVPMLIAVEVMPFTVQFPVA